MQKLPLRLVIVGSGRLVEGCCLDPERGLPVTIELLGVEGSAASSTLPLNSLGVPIIDPHHHKRRGWSGSKRTTTTTRAPAILGKPKRQACNGQARGSQSTSSSTSALIERGKRAAGPQYVRRQCGQAQEPGWTNKIRRSDKPT